MVNDLDANMALEEEATEETQGDPVLEQFQTAEEQAHWTEQLEASKKGRKEYNEKANKTIARYAAEPDDDGGAKAPFNIFFANTEIKAAAIYGKTPVPDIARRFSNQNDQVGRVAALLLQRNISYELDVHDFDSEFRQVAFDRLVPGFGVLWTSLDQDEGDTVADPVTGQPLENSHIKDQNAVVEYLAWSDFYWCPSRTWKLVPWVAKKVAMTKDDVEEAFGHTYSKIDLLPFVKSKPTEGTTQDKLAPKDDTKETIDVFEIWDKTRKLIFWVTETAETPLMVQQDQTNYPGFFPTSLPPLGRYSTSNTIPLPDYKFVEPQYTALDNLNNRITNLTQALQLKFVYDESCSELNDLYTSTAELGGVPIRDFGVLTEKGGLENVMKFVDLQPVVAAYNELLAAREKAKADIYEVEGISDILRGAAQPYETAAATSMKGATSSTRLGEMQRQVAEYIQRTLRLKAHLIGKFYLPEIILERCGQLEQADQQYVGPALQLIKDEIHRNFSINVSVDSIQASNWDTEKADRTSLVQAIAELLGQALPAIEKTPQIAPLCWGLMKFAVASYRGSEEIEGMLDAGLDQLQQAAQQAQAQPPKPDPALQVQQLKSNTQIQVAQTEAQSAQTIAQIDANTAAAEQALKAQKIALEQSKAQDDATHDRAQMHLDTVDAAHKAAMMLHKHQTPSASEMISTQGPI